MLDSIWPESNGSNEPLQLLKGDPALFAARLAYDLRDVEEELALVTGR